MAQPILINQKKAQIWSIDLVAACVIFIIGIIVLYIYSINYLNQAQDSLDNLLHDGNVAAELLLREEYPGILTDNKINQTKEQKRTKEKKKKEKRS